MVIGMVFVCKAYPKTEHPCFFQSGWRIKTPTNYHIPYISPFLKYVYNINIFLYNI